MGSGLTAKSGGRHAHASKIVIMVQSLVILSLSLWMVEEYLNNLYLREYVSGVFQADGLLFGVLGTLLVFGSASAMMLKRRMHGEKLGAVSLEVTGTVSKIKAAADTAWKPVESKPKPDMDFHPVVAALKADMANRRLSFGSVVSTETERAAPVPAPRPEAQKPSVLEQLTPNRRPPITGPVPQQVRTPFPQRPMPLPRPPAPTNPSPDQGRAVLPPRPILPVRPQQPVGSSVLQPAQPPPPQVPTNITTVITGIMPAQKKKDPAEPSDQKSSSQ